MTLTLLLAALAQLPIQEAPVDARACADCHPRQVESWKRSWHRSSLTNPHFLDGFSVEPQLRCIECHAPLSASTRDAWKVRGALARGEVSALPPSSSAHDGVSCAACHLKGGVIQAPSTGALPYAHALSVDPALRKSDFCGTCHEFTGHAVLDGATIINAFTMQSTVTEWKRWGGTQTCQGCHMPGGSHEVRGAHDTAYLKRSVSLEVRDGFALIRTHGVGHRMPTGDVFRHLVLWADDVPVFQFGLALERALDVTGTPGVRIAHDTRLRPDVLTPIPLPRGAKEVRLTFHFTEPSTRPRIGLTREDEIVALAHWRSNE